MNRPGRPRKRSLKELMDLRGRVALVTGGGGNVGAVICESLAELGTAIVVLDVASEPCKAVAAQLKEQYSVDTIPIIIDLAQETALKTVPEKILDHFGRLDVLVNCAALVGTSQLGGWAVPFLEQESQAWRLALEVNLTAPFLLAQACAKALAASKKGSIVSVSSIYGMVGPDMRLYQNTSLGNPAAYAVSKGALLQLTRWLATVLAPDVRVNAITLGGVRREQPKNFSERYESHTPLGRMATEEDVKGAIAYLASDLSEYVTGHNLVIDGGWTVW